MCEDITYCTGGDCALKYDCYRAVNYNQEGRQFVYVFPPFISIDDGHVCDCYLEITGEEDE